MTKERQVMIRKFLLAAAAAVAAAALSSCGGSSSGYAPPVTPPAAPPAAPPAPPPAAGLVLDTAQLLLLARQTSETASPLVVDGKALTLDDPSDTSEPISVNGP